MSEPTKGLRLAFTPGMLGLHFICAAGKYTDDSKGPSDMAYVNSLIEEDERRRSTHNGVLTITRDVTTVSPNFKLSVAVSEAAPQPQRYFTHADLLKLPADAELDEFGRYEGNEVVYLASDKE